jgi:hypothetical protein
MKKNNEEENLQIKSSLFRRPMRIDEEIEVAKNSEYARWFRCLKISQVYTEYSRAVVSGKRPDKINVDEGIKRTYANFGDVRRLTFEDWWRQKGRYLFALNQPLKKVKVLITESELDTLSLNNNKVVLEIPLTVTRQTVMRQIGKLVKEAYEARPPVNIYAEAPIRVKRQNSKIRMNHLDFLLDVLEASVKHKELSLIEIGEMTGVEIDLFAKTKVNEIDLNDTAFERRRKQQAVSRCINRAERLVDNAIRGVFPSFSKVDKPKLGYKEHRF